MPSFGVSFWKSTPKGAAIKGVTNQGVTVVNSIHFFVEGSLRKYRPLFESVCPAPMMVPKGQNLCTQCYTHGWLYYILDGLAKVYISTSDGNEQIIDFMKQDTLIGMDCIDDENKSVVSITSVVDMHVLPFTADILKKLILQTPSWAMTWWFTTARSCGRWRSWWEAWATPIKCCGSPRFCCCFWTLLSTGKRGRFC